MAEKVFKLLSLVTWFSILLNRLSITAIVEDFQLLRALLLDIYAVSIWVATTTDY